MRTWFSVVLALCLAGCNTVGPKALRGARFDYNEAIVRSRDEQLLLNLVRLHYRDTPQFLEVTEITTRHSITYNAGISGSVAHTDVRDVAGAVAAGVDSVSSFTRGGSDSRGGGANLGVSYQEQPLVTYKPLQGEQFVRQMLTPIAPEAILLLTQSGWSIERVMRLCVQEINGIYNAPSASGPTPEYAPEFEEFQALASTLRKLQIVHAVDLEGIEREGRLSVVFRFRTDDETREDVEQVRRMLGLDEGERAVFAHRAAVGEAADNQLTTRSLLGVLHYLSQAVRAPAHDREAGRVTVTRDKSGNDFEWARVTKDLIRIDSSHEASEDAYVQIRYRGSWFFISDTDLESKSTFGLLSNLVSLQSGEIKDISALRTIIAL